MEEFHRNGKIVRGLNASFIILIPKKDSPQRLEDYRPISLISGVYKIIAKTIFRRISRTMDDIIADNQSAFLSGRNIMDGILIVNDALDEAKRKKIKRFFFKVDFTKAYDSVNWEFLEQMIRGLNFNEKWRRWILECVQTASANVLVNGSPCVEFNMKKGL
ncbi:hypothetical protein ACS0TY_015437 [Phlomoides rotata]